MKRRSNTTNRDGEALDISSVSVAGFDHNIKVTNIIRSPGDDAGSVDGHASRGGRQGERRGRITISVGIIAVSYTVGAGQVTGVEVKLGAIPPTVIVKLWTSVPANVAGFDYNIKVTNIVRSPGD